MCKHIHKKDYFNHMSNTCTIQTWYEQSDTTSMTYPDLPHDSKGLCIFHSKDKKWKRDNHCGGRFTELFQAMSEDDNLDDIDFREVILTGFDISDDTQTIEKNAWKGERCILFGKTKTTKPVRFQGAHFIDKLVINDLTCDEALDFDEAIFKYVVIIERCQFNGYVSFIGGCRFDHNVMIEECYFGEIASFNESVFMQQLCLTDVQFEDGAIFEHSKQIADDLICQFTNVFFDGYTSFSNGGFNSSVTFDACRFGAECHFENTVFRQRTQFIDPVIEDKIFFIGTKPSIKLFENAVDFEFSEDSFSPTGQIIFQNVNLFNANAAFKESLKKLELNHHIEIREGCLLYRTSVERIFDFSQLEQFLIEDLAKTFSRYFENKHLRTLKVDVFRDLKIEKIKVIFHTDETMSIAEFEELLYKTEIKLLEFMVKPDSNLDSISTDQLFQLQSIWQRFYEAQSLPLLKQFFQGSTDLQPENVDNLLNATFNIYIKNAVIDSQLQIGGNLVIGDKT